jgi:RNA polymerase sigma-70 factor (ECF subfamily)
MPEPGGDVTQLLGELRSGNREVAAQLVPLIYGQLRRIAGAQMGHERPGHTLQATAVVHEAYLRLAGGQDGGQEIPWQNRAHFFAIAAKTMRQVLLDYSRQRHAGKRGGEGARKVELDAELLVGDDRLEDVVVVDEALGRLSELDPQQGQIVEMRFFAGLNVEETAEVLGISPSTVKREWRIARAWLQREMGAAPPP